MTAETFSSLDAVRRSLAEISSDAEPAIERWLAAACARVGDLAFARQFAAQFDRFDAPPEAYAHRLAQIAPGRRALGGVRFYGGDGARPFVDIVAWDEEAGLDRLAAAVAAEWRAFRPFALRLLTPGDALPSGGVVDQTIHVATAAQMRAPLGDLALAPIEDLAEAERFLAARYAAVAAADPALRAELSPADAAELETCRKTGVARWMIAEDRRVGLLALAPGAIAFLEGLVVWEIAVAAEAAGRGHAAEAQRLLGAALATASPQRGLLGTIHRLNAASRRSAERAGRPARFAYAFQMLTPG